VNRSLPHLRTRRQQLTWLLLSALLVRFVIPAGFMPFASPNGPYLGLCPAAGTMPATHGGHAHHGGGGAGSPGAPHHPTCVFSAGGATVFAVTPSAALAGSLPMTPAERVASLISLPAILRAQSSRGPPVHT
jgi:hypothetical protein